MRLPLLVLPCLAFVVIAPSLASAAAQTAGNLSVSATVVESCLVTAGQLQFGNVSVQTSASTATGSFSVKCTTGTDYDIGLGAGLGSGADTSVRKMTSLTSSTLNYALYQNEARTLIWGTGTSERMSGLTSSGSDQTYNVYGTIPVQTMPAEGNYSDTVEITVYY